MSAPKLASVKSGYGGRGYRIPGRTHPHPITGKPAQTVYPSVTTVLKQVAKPGLIQWAADQTAAFAVMNLNYLTTRSEEIGYRFLRFYWSRDPDLESSELRRYYDGVKDDAAELGTNIHEWIEADLNGLGDYPDLMAIETEQMIDAFRIWLLEHTVITHHSEFTMVSDRLGYAGTADADWSIRCDHEDTCLGQDPGEFKRTLVDLKSSRFLWDENGFQLAALGSAEVLMREVLPGTPNAQKAEKQEAGKKVTSWWLEDARPAWDCYALLHIRPDDLDAKGATIPRFCKLADRTPDIDVYMKGFEGALTLTQTKYELRERARARGITIETTEE